MLNPEIEKRLSQIESQCESVSGAVSSGEPVALESAAAALRQAAVDFSSVLASLAAGAQANNELKARLKRLAAGLGVHRQSLLRRSVVVERALHAMVPATRETTYAQHSGPYAGAGRQSGAFRPLAA